MSNTDGMVPRDEWARTDVARTSVLSCAHCGAGFNTPHDFYDHRDNGACHSPVFSRLVASMIAANKGLPALPAESRRVVTYCLDELDRGDRSASDQQMFREVIEDRLRRHPSSTEGADLNGH